MEDSNNTQSLDQLVASFKAATAKLPRIVGNEVVNFTLENFKRQGFLGATFQPWKKRKSPTKWGTKPKRNNRAILVDTGSMRRATRISQATWDVIKVINSDPKAKVHNEGARGWIQQRVHSYQRNVSRVAEVASIKSHRVSSKRVSTGTVTVKAHKRYINQNIPQRKFLGDSPYLRRNIERAISLEIMKALKP